MTTPTTPLTQRAGWFTALRRSWWRAAVLGVATPVLGFGVFRLATSFPPAGYGVTRTSEQIKDCEVCPTLLPIPAGQFVMGSERRFWKRSLARDAWPQHEVTIKTPFALGVYEVTFKEWDACVETGGCGGRRPDDHGWGRGDRPVVDVSWEDVQGYLSWLSEKTGKRYRLPTEAEWEYAARAGTTTPYPWGRWPSHDFSNYGKETCCNGTTEGRDEWLTTAPVGRFPANRFGLHDMIGNVYEWVEDCFVAGYAEARSDGAPVRTKDCKHVIRGSAWYSDPLRVRVAYRAWQTPDRRDKVIGFRVARDL